MQDSSKGSVIKKASQLTNAPYKTLYKIIRNGVKTRKKRSDFGKFKNLNPTTAAKIRNIVYATKRDKYPLLRLYTERCWRKGRIVPGEHYKGGSERLVLDLVPSIKRLQSWRADENPFKKRICEVFSRDGKGNLSFEDF
nr:unnamed protein product [Callosobruchus chinensis]